MCSFHHLSINQSIPLSFAQAKINSRGFGILDIKFVGDQLGYACGGSGSLFKTGAPQGLAWVWVGGQLDAGLGSSAMRVPVWVQVRDCSCGSAP